MYGRCCGEYVVDQYVVELYSRDRCIVVVVMNVVVIVGVVAHLQMDLSLLFLEGDTCRLCCQLLAGLLHCACTAGVK